MKAIFAGLCCILGGAKAVSSFSFKPEPWNPVTKKQVLAKHRANSLPGSLQSGLWAWYPFDDGTTDDKTGNGHALKAMPGATVQPQECDGGALSFDGKEGWALIESGKIFPKGDFALSFRMKANDTHSGRIFNRANYSNALGASITLGFEPTFNTRLGFGISAETNVCNKYSDLDNTNVLISKEQMKPDTWHQVVIQYYNGNMELYVDGQLSASLKARAGDFSVCPDAPFYFGKWWDQDHRSFAGLLDDIRIYTRPLNREEIDALASEPKLQVTP